VSGSNVTSQVANANFAVYSDIANSANSVTLANVSGAGNIASLNLDGNVSNILHGDGSWGPESGSLSANYANFAGQVIDATQSNITSLGTLTSLTMGGNIDISGYHIVTQDGAAGGNGTTIEYIDGNNAGGGVGFFRHNTTDDFHKWVVIDQDGTHLAQWDGANTTFKQWIIDNNNDITTYDSSNITGIGQLEAADITLYNGNVVSQGNLYLKSYSGSGSLLLDTNGSLSGANVITANYFSGDGSNLSNLNVSNATVANANKAISQQLVLLLICKWRQTLMLNQSRLLRITTNLRL
jgi:hypothetical protein